MYIYIYIYIHRRIGHAVDELFIYEDILFVSFLQGMHNSILSIAFCVLSFCLYVCDTNTNFIGRISEWPVDLFFEIRIDKETVTKTVDCVYFYLGIKLTVN